MGTRALVGRYTEDGRWRAVWVHYEAYPDRLGADLVRAVALSEGDARPVLEHLFSTRGWTMWPSDPHHPAHPDDVIFTPDNVFYDFHWFYLFDLIDRRLDVAPAGPIITPARQVRFAADGTPDDPLGQSALTLRDLIPVWDFWRIRCSAARAAALDEFLDLLEAGADLGVGVDSDDTTEREVVTTRRRIRFPGSGSGGTFVRTARSDVALPRSLRWFSEHADGWARLREAFDLPLHIDEEGLWSVQEVVAEVSDRESQIALDQALRLDPEIRLGERLMRLLRRDPGEACVFILKEALEVARARDGGLSQMA